MAVNYSSQISRKFCSLVGVALLLVGCRSSNEWLPMPLGKTWDYSIRKGLNKSIERVRVTRHVPIGGTEGVELASPTGVTRLAWVNDRLISDMVVNSRFKTPVTIARTQEVNAYNSWQGDVEVAGITYPASTQLQVVEEKLDLVSGKVNTMHSTLILTIDSVPKRTIQIDTWLQKGVGIVRQEQQINQRMDTQIELLPHSS